MAISARSHEHSVLVMLRDDEAFAIEYLSVALDEIDEAGGKDALLVTVRRLSTAKGWNWLRTQSQIPKMPRNFSVTSFSRLWR